MINLNRSSAPTFAKACAGKTLVVVVILLLVIAAATVYFLWPRDKSESGDGQGVAQLVYLLKRVEARRAGKINWLPAILRQDLFIEDAVKTDAESAAVISFLEGDTIRLDENALIIIRSLRDYGGGNMEASLEIVSGTIQGSATKLRMKVKTPTTTMVIVPSQIIDKPSRVIISADEDEQQRPYTSISVVDGIADAFIGDQSVTIEEGKALLLDETASQSLDVDAIQSSIQVLPATPEPLEPADDALLAIAAGKNSRPVSFSWKPTTALSHLQVAKDRQFRQLVLNRYTEKQRVILTSLESGTYYWNVAAVLANQIHGAFTRTRRFSVVNVAEQPEAAIVETSKAYVAKKSVSSIKLIDKDNKSVGLKKGGKIFGKQKLDIPPTGLAELAFEGVDTSTLQLRANALVAFLKVGELGEEKYASLIRLERGAIVVRVDPAVTKVALQAVQVGDTTFRFSAENSGGRRSDILIEKLPDGRYRLTVLRGRFDAGGTFKNLTASQGITIDSNAKIVASTSKAPAVMLKAGDAADVFFTSEMPLIELAWQAGEQGGPYLVEVSRRKDFSDVILSEEVNQPNYPLLVDGAGEYYWRYTTEDGKPSSASNFVLKRQTAAKRPSRKLRISADSKETIAEYHGVALETTWVWRRNPQAIIYQIEIFEDEKLTKRIFQSEKVRKTELTVVIDLLGLGTYYWRVRDLDFRGRVVRLTEPRILKLLAPNLSRALVLFTPQDNLFYDKPNITVSGQVRTGGKLTINEQPINVDKEGKFNKPVTLVPGENLLVVKFTDAKGNVSIENKKVFYTKR